MKQFLKKYLLRQPTFFAWLCILACLAAIVYLVFGVIAITQSAEGVMVLLFVPYFIAITVFIFAGDFILRTLLKKRLLWISVLELLLFAAISFQYYHTKLYKIQLVVNHPTSLIVLVKDNERGLEIKHCPFQLHFSAEVPPDNIVTLDSSSFDLLWYNLRIKSNAGDVYTNFYPMQYGDRSTVRCAGRDYYIQFVQLEIKGKRPTPMNDRVFDSVQQAVCYALARK